MASIECEIRDIRDQLNKCAFLRIDDDEEYEEMQASLAISRARITALSERVDQHRAPRSRAPASPNRAWRPARPPTPKKLKPRPRIDLDSDDEAPRRFLRSQAREARYQTQG